MRHFRSVFFGALVALTVLSVPAAAQAPEVELGECESAYPGGDEMIQKSVRALRGEDYVMARIYANNALDANQRDAHALYLLGEIGIRQRNLRMAEAYWTQCLSICPDYKAELQFFLGVILLENGRKQRGEELLEKYLQNDMRHGGFDAEAELALEESRLIDRLRANPVPFEPRVVRGVSTSDDEYLAIISPDQQYCFFTRRLTRRSRYGGVRNSAQVVEEFMVTRDGGSGFDEGQLMPQPFNTNFNEGAPTVTANNRELYFTACEDLSNGYRNCDIYYSIKTGDYWSPIESLGENINSPTSWESQPSVSPNGDRLYFTSNRQGGLGGLDLYVVYKNPDGTWSDPENLGDVINTPKDEKSPFIHSDSRTLYFASNGHPGMGGYDIYYAQQDGFAEFQKPVNIGYPINKESDELGLFVSLDGSKAYFSSNELRGPGGWDLYEFALHASARPEEVAIVRGVLRDENNQIVTDADVTIKNLATRDIQRIDVDDITGEYTAVVTLAPEEDVIIKIEKDGAAFSSKFVNRETVESGIVEADLEVAELKVGREYRLNDINFATNSFELDNTAMLIIEEFALFLEEQTNVHVDIQGHTDFVGEDNDNLVLSRNRARVVYEYLVDWGISPGRMTHHGYGETRPIASNDTEDGRAKNRRTIFVITKL